MLTIFIWISHPGFFQKSLEIYMEAPQGSIFFSRFLYGTGSGITRGFQGSCIPVPLTHTGLQTRVVHYK